MMKNSMLLIWEVRPGWGLPSSQDPVRTRS